MYEYLCQQRGPQVPNVKSQASLKSLEASLKSIQANHMYENRDLFRDLSPTL